MATDIMSLLGNVPKSALERIFAALSGLPEAQYEHTPRMERQPSVPVQVGDGSGPLDGPMNMPPPQETLPGARTGQLSRFGKFTKQLLPEMIRGAVVGASTPVKGGTAENIFGTIRNVADDRQERQDRAQGQAEKQWQWHRQMRKDDESSQLHGAQMESYSALARQRNAQADRQPAAPKDPVAKGKAILQGLRDQGIEPSEEDVRVAYGVQGMPYAARTMQAKLANAQNDYHRGPDSASLKEQYPTLEDYMQGLRVMAEDFKKAEARGNAEGKAEGTPLTTKTLNTAGGFMNQTMQKRLPNRKTLGVNTSEYVQTPDGGVAKPPERKVAPPRPRQLGPADDRRNEQKTVERIANEAFNAAGGDAAKAIEVLKQKAQTDREVAANIVAATRRLQSLIVKKDDSAQLESLLKGMGVQTPQTPTRPASPSNPYR